MDGAFAVLICVLITSPTAFFAWWWHAVVACRARGRRRSFPGAQLAAAADGDGGTPRSLRADELGVNLALRVRGVARHVGHEDFVG